MTKEHVRWPIQTSFNTYLLSSKSLANNFRIFINPHICGRRHGPNTRAGDYRRYFRREFMWVHGDAGDYLEKLNTRYSTIMLVDVDVFLLLQLYCTFQSCRMHQIRQQLSFNGRPVWRRKNQYGKDTKGKHFVDLLRLKRAAGEESEEILILSLSSNLFIHGSIVLRCRIRMKNSVSREPIYLLWLLVPNLSKGGEEDSNFSRVLRKKRTKNDKIKIAEQKTKPTCLPRGYLGSDGTVYVFYVTKYRHGEKPGRSDDNGKCEFNSFVSKLMDIELKDFVPENKEFQECSDPIKVWWGRDSVRSKIKFMTSMTNVPAAYGQKEDKKLIIENVHQTLDSASPREKLFMCRNRGRRCFWSKKIRKFAIGITYLEFYL